MFFRDSLPIINWRLQTLRSVEEELRQALDKAKTYASQTSAALAQLQARETILTADIECKVTACSLLLLLISWPVSARFRQTGLITRFFINEHAVAQKQPKVEAKKVRARAAAACIILPFPCCFASCARPCDGAWPSGLVRRHAGCGQRRAN